MEGRTFAKYLYKWGYEYFIVYVVQIGFNALQYILKEPGEGESTMSRNGVTDQLVATVGQSQKPQDENYVYVYDGYWTMSRALFEEVQKANWDDVILDEGMKKALTELMHKFFDSEDIYKDLGVPWKRGVIFHGVRAPILMRKGPADRPPARREWQNDLDQGSHAFSFPKGWVHHPIPLCEVCPPDVGHPQHLRDGSLHGPLPVDL